jgi:hypothetical protein
MGNRNEKGMPVADEAVSEAAYFIWESEGRPEGKALDHWDRAVVQIAGSDDDLLDEQEKIMADLPANLPALLTKDARGG